MKIIIEAIKNWNSKVSLSKPPELNWVQEWNSSNLSSWLWFRPLENAKHMKIDDSSKNNKTKASTEFKATKQITEN